MSKIFTKNRLKEFSCVILGSFILAVSINSILLPNQIVAGGANGISIVINHLFGIKLATTLYVINFPLLILCLMSIDLTQLGTTSQF